MNVWVTGANGQLGQALQSVSHRFPAMRFFWTSHQDFDIRQPETKFCGSQNISSWIKQNHIHAIVNCAAYTQVDLAESNPHEAFAVNADGVAFLANIAQQFHLRLIHISTDYVFDGKKNTPYQEDDPVNPINVYGSSKRAGEEAILNIAPKNAMIIRVSWLYGMGENHFIKTILRLGQMQKTLSVVADQIGSPTYALDFAEAILTILPKINHDKPQIYHYANGGEVSRFDWARTAFEWQNEAIKITPTNTKGLFQGACRPLYTVLNTEKIQRDFALIIPSWQDGLRRYLKGLA